MGTDGRLLLQHSYYSLCISISVDFYKIHSGFFRQGQMYLINIVEPIGLQYPAQQIDYPNTNVGVTMAKLERDILRGGIWIQQNASPLLFPVGGSCEGTMHFVNERVATAVAFEYKIFRFEIKVCGFLKRSGGIYVLKSIDGNAITIVRSNSAHAHGVNEIARNIQFTDENVSVLVDRLNIINADPRVKVDDEFLAQTKLPDASSLLIYASEPPAAVKV